MMHGMLNEYERVFWNNNQRIFNSDEESSIGRVYYRPYCWDEESPRCDLPNFGLSDDPVEIRWYKYFSRGLECNIKLSRGEWIAWHNRVVGELRRMDGTRA